MLKILCDVNPFCFGSTATMRAVMSEVPGADVVVIGCEASADLCRDLDFQELNVKDPAALGSRRDLLEWAEFFVAFSNNTNVPVALDAGLPLAFVDIHFELKRRETLAMRDAQAYVIETHPGVHPVLERWAPAHPVLVGPMIVPGARSERCLHPLMVNIGGATSPDVQPGLNSAYPTRVLELIDRVAGRMKLGRVPVAMGSNAASTAPEVRGAEAVTLAAAEYRTRLEASGVLLTAPGLNAPMEAFARKVPVIFLPPQNLTQVHHLRTYVEAGLAPAGEQLLELVPGRPVDASRCESDGTAQVLHALAELGTAGWRKVQAIVEQQLAWPRVRMAGLAERQHAWWRRLGSNGAADAASAIRSVLP